MRNLQVTITGVLFSTLVLIGIGCTPPKQDEGPGTIERAKTAFEAKDYETTIRLADEQLTGPANTRKSRIQSYYLKGRAIESRDKPNQSAVASDLAAARSMYERALNENPEEPERATIRSSLANVAYFQDDFIIAMSNWNSALEVLKNPATRSWIEYRLGLSQQRLGRFQQADLTFERVQRNYPGTEPAKRAKEHQGTKSFSVQVGAFNKPEVADELVTMLQKKGLKPTKRTDLQGKHAVVLTDYPTYDAAKKARLLVTGDYPEALILP